MKNHIGWENIRQLKKLQYTVAYIILQNIWFYAEKTNKKKHKHIKHHT